MPNQVEIVTSHLRNCSSSSVITCIACNLIVTKDAKKYLCEICGEKFQNKTNLKRHITQHNEIICYVCRKTFKSYTNLRSHKKLHEEQNVNFNCPICGMKMNRKYNLMVHVSSHTANHPCRICCASFNSDLLLGHHKLTHSKEDIEAYENFESKIICEICKMNFDSRFTLYMHTLSQHNVGVEKYLCQCGRIFESDIMLKNHKKKHHNSLFECKVCNKKFKKLRGLEEHQNTHFDSRPFQCDECGKRFRYSSNLSQHRTMHRGVRNFACVECGKKFLRSNTLAMHLKSHNNIRKYNCEYCCASFVQSSSLMKHKRTIHRFCENCGEMIGDRKQWRIHVWKKCNVAQDMQSTE